MHRINHALTDDEVCVNVDRSNALFSFTFNGEPVYITNPETSPKDVCELRRVSVELFRMVRFEAVGECLFVCETVGNRGTVHRSYFDAADVIRNVGIVESGMDIRRIESDRDQLAVFALACLNVLAGILYAISESPIWVT